MPQFDYSSFISQLFWLSIVFTVIYIFLAKIALPKMTQIIADREARINDNMKSAQALQLEAEALLSSYESELSKAKSEALNIINASVNSSKSAIDEKNKNLEIEIQEKLNQAQQQLNTEQENLKKIIEQAPFELASVILDKLANLKIEEDKVKKLNAHISVD